MKDKCRGLVGEYQWAVKPSLKIGYTRVKNALKRQVKRSWRWRGWSHASLSCVMKKVLIVISLSVK